MSIIFAINETLTPEAPPLFKERPKFSDFYQIFPYFFSFSNNYQIISRNIGFSNYAINMQRVADRPGTFAADAVAVQIELGTQESG